MESLMRIAVAATTLLCGRADARLAAADVLRPAARAEPGASYPLQRRDTPGGAGRWGRGPQPIARDAWFGDDKFRHFAMSFATATFTYAAARTAGLEDTALPAAVAVAAAAGVGKEVYDRRIGRAFSLRDLAWDAFGVGVGYAFLRQIE